MELVSEIAEDRQKFAYDKGINYDKSKFISGDDMVLQLDQVYKEMLEMECNLEKEQAALKSMQVNFASLTPDTLKNHLKEQLNGSSLDIYDNENYRDFRERLWEIYYPQAAFKFMSNERDDSDDIEMVSQATNYICPITQTVMEDPLISTICRHSFSKAILAMCQRGGTMCPIPGCGAFIKTKDLEENRPLKRKIARWMEQQ